MKNVLLAISILLLISCDERKEFDSSKWRFEENSMPDGDRKKMVRDLTTNVLVISQSTKREVDSLLGKPSYYNECGKSFDYLVEEKYGRNIDPEGYIYLKLFFNKDSILESWTLQETTFDP